MDELSLSNEVVLKITFSTGETVHVPKKYLTYMNIFNKIPLTLHEYEEVLATVDITTLTFILEWFEKYFVDCAEYGANYSPELKKKMIAEIESIWGQGFWSKINISDPTKTIWSNEHITHELYTLTQTLEYLRISYMSDMVFYGIQYYMDHDHSYSNKSPRQQIFKIGHLI